MNRSGQSPALPDGVDVGPRRLGEDRPGSNRTKILGAALHWLALIAVLSGLACAGANGDPAPAPQEAGASEVPSCVDAGAAE
jgi:hypothetical protein